MALMKEDICSLETGDGLRVEAMFGGWQTADSRVERSRHYKESCREGGWRRKEDEHVEQARPAMQGVADVWALLTPPQPHE